MNSPHDQLEQPVIQSNRRTPISLAGDPRVLVREYERVPKRRLSIGFFESVGVLLLLFVIAGSLYPFNFDFSLTSSRLEGFSLPPGRADLLANIALFVPLGFAAGMLRTTSARITGVMLAFAVAIGCQLAQIYLPTRVPAMWDIVFNSAGLLVGLLLTRFVQHPSSRTATRLSLTSFVMIASFLGYQLAPFAPSLDFGLLRASAQRLLDASTFEFGALFTGFIYVLLIAGALKAELSSKNANRLLITLIGAVLVLKPITAAAHVNAITLVGMLAALYPACRLPSNRWVFGALAGLALWLYIYDGLTPFILREQMSIPALSPLETLVGGSWVANLTAILWKSFLLIVAISLLFAVYGDETQAPTATVIGVAMFVEGSQMFVASGTPSTIDVLLAIAISAIFLSSVRTTSHHTEGYGRNHRLKKSSSSRH
ncbi:MAG: VanZ family protein [Burkholderiaceae bacterium]